MGKPSSLKQMYTWQIHPTWYQWDNWQKSWRLWGNWEPLLVAREAGWVDPFRAQNKTTVLLLEKRKACVDKDVHTQMRTPRCVLITLSNKVSSCVGLREVRDGGRFCYPMHENFQCEWDCPGIWLQLVLITVHTKIQNRILKTVYVNVCKLHTKKTMNVKLGKPVVKNIFINSCKAMDTINRC